MLKTIYIDAFLVNTLTLYYLLFFVQGKPMIIFKATPNKIGKKHGNKASVTYEIYHNLKDKWGNWYPEKNLVYITVSLTASSSALLTLEYLDEVYFPEVGLDAYGELLNNSGLVLDTFRGHYEKGVKAVTEPM